MNLVSDAKFLAGRFVLLNLRPIADRDRDERGRCNICGRNSKFAFNSWVNPDDAFGDDPDPAIISAFARRESLFCRRCSSSQRVRQIADVLLEAYGRGEESIDDLVRQEEFRRLDIAEINSIGSLGSLHRFLAKLPRLNFSEYRGLESLGQIIGGVRNEDMCALTYPDESFDLVVSSDTLEHVPDFPTALRETRRVLKRGGRHIFTVPLILSRLMTYARCKVTTAGDIEHLLPPLFHGRGRGLYRLLPTRNGMLTYTEFGQDLVDYVQLAGFDVEAVGANQANETGAEIVFCARVPE